MTRRLEIDLETRSQCDLVKSGVYVYAEHKSTRITHFAWAWPDKPVQVWLPWLPASFETVGTTVDGVPVHIYGGPLPAELADALADPTVTLVAHNAAFERTMLSGLPGVLIDCPDVSDPARWDCTAARAAAAGLPRTLAGACAASGVTVRKDADGHKLMMRMCKPLPVRKGGDPTVRWLDDDASMIREAEYCAHDVYAERAIDAQIPPLSAFERRVWLLTEAMNDRGVLVDTDMLLRVSMLVEDAERSVNARLSHATGGAVPKVTNHAALSAWLVSQDADDTGLGESGVGKAALAAMLERADLSPLIRDVLVMREHGGKSSSSKYRAILNRLSRDGRIRGVLVYCGAASTGRYSSRGAQLHNLPRSTLLKKRSAVEALMRDLRDGATLAEIEEFHGPPLVLASELLRPVFIASAGRMLARGDSSQIEARITPWLAGAEWKLDAFRAYDAGTGPDLYRVGAAGILGCGVDDVTDEQRQGMGKVPELSLQFQGGTGALQAMCRAYKMKIPSWEPPAGVKPWGAEPPAGSDAWIVRRWRDKNPEISDRDDGLWKRLERAAIACMESSPGVWCPAYDTDPRRRLNGGHQGVGFRRTNRCLLMRLPSGRNLVYWTPELRMVERFGYPRLTVIYRAENSQTKQWEENHAYGGLWTENPTQAIGRDLMCYWLLEMAAAGILPVLTVHDEGIGETTLPADEATALMTAIMRRTPDWAAGLPVSSEASAGPRYMK